MLSDSNLCNRSHFAPLGTKSRGGAKLDAERLRGCPGPRRRTSISLSPTFLSPIFLSIVHSLREKQWGMREERKKTALTLPSLEGRGDRARPASERLLTRKKGVLSRDFSCQNGSRGPNLAWFSPRGGKSSLRAKLVASESPFACAIARRRAAHRRLWPGRLRREKCEVIHVRPTIGAWHASSTWSFSQAGKPDVLRSEDAGRNRCDGCRYCTMLHARACRSDSVPSTQVVAFKGVVNVGRGPPEGHQTPARRRSETLGGTVKPPGCGGRVKTRQKSSPPGLDFIGQYAKMVGFPAGDPARRG